MRRLEVILSREKADRMKQVQAVIGRALRHECDATQPLPDRLAALVKKLEQINQR